ncbi:MAG: type II secretion system protein [Sedimentisphaerales bacterium]|nr:type II secretion system protein [Sedimentisphaerales bacterium]
MLRVRIDRGFTLIELLIVMAVISVLVGLLIPAAQEVRRQSRAVQGGNNQRQIVTSVNIFAIDHRDWYPPSVATIGTTWDWHWQEPMMIVGFNKRDPQGHRSLAAYLRRYIPDPDSLFCPNAPQRYPHLQEAWDAGDEWDHPGAMTLPLDPLIGTYCFYWNYVGYLPDRPYPFVGPRRAGAAKGQSALLVSDYFGFDHWRSREMFAVACYGSCDHFDDADVTGGTEVSSSYWSRPGQDEQLHRYPPPEIQLRAGYSDGHIETYGTEEVIEMKVSLTADGTLPYPDGVGPGTFFLPGESLR